MSTAEITIEFTPQDCGFELKGKYKTYNYDFVKMDPFWGGNDTDLLIELKIHSPPPRNSKKHIHTLYVSFNPDSRSILGIWEWIVDGKKKIHNEIPINNSDVRVRIINETPNTPHVEFTEEPVDEDPQ